MNREQIQLRKKLRDLDRLRTRIEQARDQERPLHAECIVLMRQAGYKRLNISENRTAVLTEPVRRKVSVDAFRRAALEANLDDAQIDQVVTETVSVTRAEKLLGAERLDAIATTEPGEPAVKITGRT
ncbi:MAG TPA: hypothetical protein PKC49_11310 [Phycisphaerae bacterium]|nr:hypothetical protein [Phycisphaerae bacterium]